MCSSQFQFVQNKVLYDVSLAEARAASPPLAWVQHASLAGDPVAAKAKNHRGVSDGRRPSAKSNWRNLSGTRVHIFTTLQVIVMKENTAQLQTSSVTVVTV